MGELQPIEHARRHRPSPPRWRRRGRRRLEGPHRPYRQRMIMISSRLLAVLHLVEAVALDPAGVLLQALADPLVAEQVRALVRQAIQEERRTRRRGGHR